MADVDNRWRARSERAAVTSDGSAIANTVGSVTSVNPRPVNDSRTVAAYAAARTPRYGLSGTAVPVVEPRIRANMRFTANPGRNPVMIASVPVVSAPPVTNATTIHDQATSSERNNAFRSRIHNAADNSTLMTTMPA